MVSPENGYYGHRAILNRFVGVPEARSLAGTLQHGWYMAAGPRRRSQRIPRFVWGDRNLGGARAIPVGAPFLYHERVRRPSAPAGSALLSMPYHGHGADLDGAHTQYASFLESIQGDYDAITVCLHPLEYGTPIQDLYDRRGFSVVTNGDRHDQAFLDRLLDLLSKHASITTNRLSTGLLYGAALGRHVFTGGPFARSADRGMLEMSYEQQWDLYQREFGHLAEGLSGDEARRFAGRELGADHVRDPGELRDLLGSTGTRRVAAAGLAASSRLWKRLRGVEFGPTDAALGRDGTEASLRVQHVSEDPGHA